MKLQCSLLCELVCDSRTKKTPSDATLSDYHYINVTEISAIGLEKQLTSRVMRYFCLNLITFHRHSFIHPLAG